MEVGLKLPVGAVTPRRGPGYLHLRLVPLVIHLDILQLLQPPLQLVPGLAPLPQLVQQHVARVHPLIDFGLELLPGHLDGHARVRQARRRAHWAPVGEGGPAWKTPLKAEPGTLGRCSRALSLPWQDGVWESFVLGRWLGYGRGGHLLMAAAGRAEGLCLMQPRGWASIKLIGAPDADAGGERWHRSVPVRGPRAKAAPQGHRFYLHGLITRSQPWDRQ